MTPWDMMAEGMRRCLPPLLAALTVLVLALLPPRLSLLGDETGVIHTEALGEDSNFPARPPELPGRIDLLAWWRQSPGSVTIVEQSVEELAAQREAEARARGALAELTEAGVLPAGQPDFEEGFTVSRLYLRDQSDLSSAGFWLVENRDQKEYALSMALDMETGRALTFRLAGPRVFMEDLTPQEMGRRFLDRLGLESQPQGVSGLYSYDFRLPDCRSVLTTTVSHRLMKFDLEVDWSGRTDETPEAHRASAASEK